MNLEIEGLFWRRGIQNIVGVDEAGRGPIAGPVVAAAVVFAGGRLIDGVDDSKKLSEKKREELFDEITKHALSIGVGVVDHNEIDRINILQASLKAMEGALKELTVTPGIVLADGNSFKHDRFLYENIIDGDAKSFTIAAASIIAKVTRDRLMKELDSKYPGYGFAKHKGYGTKEHLDAIKRLGLCEIHRKSFRPFVVDPQIEMFSDHV